MLVMIFAIATFCFGMHIAESESKKRIENLCDYIEQLEEELRQYRTE